jgi:hypothetical protein
MPPLLGKRRIVDEPGFDRAADALSTASPVHALSLVASKILESHRAAALLQLHTVAWLLPDAAAVLLHWHPNAAYFLETMGYSSHHDLPAGGIFWQWSHFNGSERCTKFGSGFCKP